MAVQVRARMTTVLISSVILRMIIGGFRGSTVIVISAEAALDPMCAGSHEWFCSATDFDIPQATRQKILYRVTALTKCSAVYDDDIPDDGVLPVAYRHSSCADSKMTDAHIPKAGPNCFDCLVRATKVMYNNCRGKDGAQYGTEQCCARYEKYNFCGA